MRYLPKLNFCVQELLEKPLLYGFEVGTLGNSWEEAGTGRQGRNGTGQDAWIPGAWCGPGTATQGLLTSKGSCLSDPPSLFNLSD